MPEEPRWASAWQAREEEFLNRTKELLEGQLKSLGQFNLTDAHNWKWYYEEVLNQKTFNFFLGPISLYCLTSTSLEKYEILKDYFLFLNSTYFHWQLIDDIADLIDDIHEGMVTSPGYILTSQGQLAAQLRKHVAILENNNGIDTNNFHRIVEQKIIRSAIESDLLIEDFCSPALWHELLAYRDRKTRNNDRTTLVNLAKRYVRSALANTPL